MAIEFRFQEFASQTMDLFGGGIIADINLAWANADQGACGVLQSVFATAHL